MHVALSLGSNLGDALETCAGVSWPSIQLKRYGSKCGRIVTRRNRSVLRANPPFMNLAAIANANLTPEAFLRAMLSIELDHGRVRQERWQPRALDIDIILWGDAVIDEPDLHVPHREFRTRAFVLTPLAEIAPEMTDPVSGMTIAQLAEAGEGVTGKRCKLDL